MATSSSMDSRITESMLLSERIALYASVKSTVDVSGDKGKIVIAERLGISRHILTRALAVVNALNDPHPRVREVAQQAVLRMDATGCANSCYNQIRRVRQEVRPSGIGRRQGSLLDRTCTALRAISQALSNVDRAHPGSSVEDRSKWIKEFTEARTSIDTVISSLEERDRES